MAPRDESDTIENIGVSSEDNQQESDINASNNGKSKKPKDSAFKQQRLPAWQPILTAGTVLPTFFVIGFAFIPIGIGMLWFSDNVQEHSENYTSCNITSPVGTGYKTCDQYVEGTLNQTSPATCTCSVEFELENAFEGEVFMYYGLTNFYQNHRRYVKSRDDTQLLGNVNKNPSSDCEPFDKDENGKPYVPCGAIANSLFSDDITLEWSKDGTSYIPIKLNNTGIAWESDKKYKFKNPDTEGTTLEEALKDTARPKNWHKDLWELDKENPENNGLQNEDLIVWMRTAALPNFRKLYRRIDHSSDDGIKDGLPAGKYKFNINYRFRVTPFSGTKSVILSTTSILGGKNPFLGIAYISVGSICMLMGVVFLVIHIKYGKPISEMMNINARSTFN